MKDEEGQEEDQRFDRPVMTIWENGVVGAEERERAAQAAQLYRRRARASWKERGSFLGDASYG